MNIFSVVIFIFFWTFFLTPNFGDDFLVCQLVASACNIGLILDVEISLCLFINNFSFVILTISAVLSYTFEQPPVKFAPSV